MHILYIYAPCISARYFNIFIFGDAKSKLEESPWFKISLYFCCSYCNTQNWMLCFLPHVLLLQGLLASYVVWTGHDIYKAGINSLIPLITVKATFNQKLLFGSVGSEFHFRITDNFAAFIRQSTWKRYMEKIHGKALQCCTFYTNAHLP